MLLFFAVSLFVSSSLLFLVQPLIGKMILPTLGGTPAVWNTCMVFFQAVLLVGYAYTHSLSTWSNRRLQVIVHLCLLALPFVTLPFVLGDWEPSLEHNPVFAVLWLLLGLVGLPFFVVATSAPLLQKWFTHTGHAAAKDPYFLYGASNLGSMLALLLYPVVVEPYFAVEAQSILWTIGYGVLAVLVAACGLVVLRAPAPVVLAVAPTDGAARPASVKPLTAAAASTAVQPWRRPRRSRSFFPEALPGPKQPGDQTRDLERNKQRLRWLGLASLPLGTLLLFAKYLNHDLARQPVLWVALWAIYGAGFFLLVHATPWKWLDDARITFLVLQPVVAAAAFAGLLFSIQLPSGVWFVIYMTALLIPLYFLLADLQTAGRPSEAPTLSRRLRWIGLAAAPSSLMLGVTTYLTSDISAIPLFWIIPLTLYLLTFILVFLRWPVTWVGMPHTVILWVQPLAMAFLVMLVLGNAQIPIWSYFALHLVVFFLTALVCHGELAKDRPVNQYLTEFYLWMSVGGVLGGIFNGLIAPVAFQFGVVEYPLAALLAIALRPNLVGQQTLIPGDSRPRRETDLGRALDLFLPIAVSLTWFITVTIKLHETTFRMFGWDVNSAGPSLFVVMLVALVFCARPLRTALILTGIMVAAGTLDRDRDGLIFEERGFFGFLRVREYAVRDRIHGGHLIYRTLYHGGINHGSQYLFRQSGEETERLHPLSRRRLVTYFTVGSGVGQVFEMLKGVTPVWPDARLAASLIGMGGSWSQLATVIAPSQRIGVPIEEHAWTDFRLAASLVGLGADPFGQLVDLHSEPPYAVVGLGLGTLAAHARPLQHLTIYEIDPTVIRLSDPAHFDASADQDPMFYYVKDARDRGARVDIVLGDGRLSLKRAPERYYHVLVLDAFSGDAIPVHLLTDEAVKLYLSKLADGGVLIFNATNRYVDLRPVLADVAERNGLVCLAYGDWARDDDRDHYSSDWVVLQRKAETFRTQNGSRRHRPNFNGLPPLPQYMNLAGWDQPAATGLHLWTDKYSNLLRVLNLKGVF